MLSHLDLRPGRALRALGAATFVMLATGCAVGPDYERPALTLPQRVEGEQIAPAQAAVQPAARAPLETDWWKRFGSDKLNRLVDRALAGNPGVEAGQAALRAAAEGVRAQMGAYYPQVGASYGYQTQQTESQLASPLANNAYNFSLHTVQLSVAYVPDVFGLNRRAVEGLRAAADSQAYTLAATRITLAANVVVAAATEAGLRAQLRMGENQVQLQQQLLEAMRRMQAAGGAAEADVLAQEIQTESMAASLTALRRQLDVTRDLLKNLVGAYPSDVLGSEFELTDFSTPADIPVTLPSELLEKRPDVRVAEENLHAASAAIGVAVANRLPQITLGGLIGQSSSQWSDLFNSENSFWVLSGGIAAPIFAGGTLAARERQARANYDQAAAMYRLTVLTAFQGVADALTTVSNDREAVRRQTLAALSARRLERIGSAQNRLGDLSAVALIPLQLQALQAESALAQNQSQHLADIAALCQALGGGWTAEPAELAEPAVSSR